MSAKRTETLLSLFHEGAVTQGIITERALAHGSGPKPQPDFGYSYYVNGAEYAGTIMGRGAFKLSPTLFSVNYLEKKPVIGENISITYLPQEPSVSVPFLITEKSLSSCRLSGYVLSGGILILGISLFILVQAIKRIKGAHV